MFCTACGCAASEGDRFCRQCGRGLAEAVEAPPAPAVVPHIVTAAPEPARPRRIGLPKLLRALSLLGMLPSLVGAWMLLQEPSAEASSGREPSGEVRAQPSAEPSGEPTPSMEPSSEPSPSVEPEPTLRTCSSPFLGFSVTYPASLVTMEAPAKHACRYFDPEPFDLPKGSDLPQTQVRIYPSRNSYRRFDKLFDPETNFDVISRLNTVVGGYRAIRVEMQTHAKAGDSRLYAYVVDAGGQMIVLDTYKGYDADYAAAKADLDQMASALEFPSGGTS